MADSEDDIPLAFAIKRSHEHLPTTNLEALSRSPSVHIGTILDSAPKPLSIVVTDSGDFAISDVNVERTLYPKPSHLLTVSRKPINLTSLQLSKESLNNFHFDSVESLDVLNSGSLLKVVKGFRALELEELELEIGDLIELEHMPDHEDYWYYGQMVSGIRKGAKGFFPKECVVAGQPDAIQTVAKDQVVIAEYDFDPEQPDELEFSEGDQIVVLESPEGGWWRGYLIDQPSKIGWFPCNYVKQALKIEERKQSLPESSGHKILRKQSMPDVPSRENSQKSTETKKPKKTVTLSQESIQKSDTSSRESRLPRLPSKESVSSQSTIIPTSVAGRFMPIKDAPTSIGLGLARSNETLAQGFIKQLQSQTDLSEKKHQRSKSTSNDQVSEPVPLLSKGVTWNKKGSKESVDPEPVPLSKEMKEKRSRSSSAPAGSRESLANSLEDVISSQESIKEALTEWQQKFTKDQLAQLTPQQRKLYSAIWELIMTERDYCRDLAILVNDFMKPMQNMKLDKRNLQLLFCNIEYLLTISTDFLQQLEGLSDLKDLKKCADVFMQTAERFMHYTPFCAMQQTTNKQVQQMLSKPEVKAFLQKTYQKPHLRKLDLNGFMLKPVQRICKYPLLIREIIKHASTSHPDYPDLQRALEKIQGAVKAINECSKKLVSYEAIYETQTRFAEKINISNPNRFLVREDAIQVIFASFFKTRKIFLFNDILIIARKERMRDKHHVIEKTVIKDTRVCDIVDNAQDRVQRYMLEIEILPNSEYDTPNRYIVSFATKQDKDTWLDAYKSLVKMAVKTKNLQDISMTVTKMDQQDEDDQVEPGSPTKEQEKPSDMRTRFEQLELQYDQALAKIKHLEQQLDTVSKQPSVGQSDPLLEQKSLEMQQDLTSKQSVIDQLQQDMALKQNALDQLKTQLESKQGDLERLLQEKQTLNEQLDQKHAESASQSQTLLSIQEDLKTKELLYEKAMQEMAQLQSQNLLEISGLENAVSSHQQTLKEREDKIQQQQLLLDTQSTRLAELETTVKSQQASFESSQESLKETLTLNAALKHDLEEKESDLKQAKRLLSEMSTEIGQKDKQIQNLSAQVHPLESTIKKLEADLSLSVQKHQELMSERVREQQLQVQETELLHEKLAFSNAHVSQLEHQVQEQQLIAVHAVEQQQLVQKSFDAQQEHQKVLLDKIQQLMKEGTEKDNQLTDLRSHLVDKTNMSHELQENLSIVQSALDLMESKLKDTQESFAKDIQVLSDKNLALEEQLNVRNQSVQDLSLKLSEQEQRLQETIKRSSELESLKGSLSEREQTLLKQIQDLDIKLLDAQSALEKHLQESNKTLEDVGRQFAEKESNLLSNIQKLESQISGLQEQVTKQQSMVEETGRNHARESKQLNDQILHWMRQSDLLTEEKSKREHQLQSVIEALQSSLDQTANDLEQQSAKFKELEAVYDSVCKERDQLLTDKNHSEQVVQEQLLQVQDLKEQLQMTCKRLEDTKSVLESKTNLLNQQIATVLSEKESQSVDINALQQKLSQTKADLEHALQENQSLLKQSDQSTLEIQQKNQAIAELESLLQSTNQKLSSAEFERESLLLQQKTLESNNLELKQVMEQLLGDQETTKDKLREKESLVFEQDLLLNEKSAEFNRLSLLRDSLAVQLQESEQLVQSLESELQSALLHSQTLEREKLVSHDQWKAEIQSLEQKLLHLESQLTEKESIVSELKTRVLSQQEQSNQLEQVLKDKTAELKQQRDANQDLSLKIQQAQQTVQNLESDLSSKDQDLHSLKTSLSAMEESLLKQEFDKSLLEQSLQKQDQELKLLVSEKQVLKEHLEQQSLILTENLKHLKDKESELVQQAANLDQLRQDRQKLALLLDELGQEKNQEQSYHQALSGAVQVMKSDIETLKREHQVQLREQEQRLGQDHLNVLQSTILELTQRHQETVNALNERYHSKELESHTLKSQLNVLEQLAQKSEASVREKEQLLQTQQLSFDKMQSELLIVEKQLSDSKNQIETLLKDALESVIQIKNRDNQIQQLEMQLLQQAQSFRNDLVLIEQQLRESQSQREATAEKLTALESERTSLSQQLLDSQTREQAVALTLHELQSELVETKQQLRVSQDQLKQTHEQMQASKQELHDTLLSSQQALSTALDQTIQDLQQQLSREAEKSLDFEKQLKSLTDQRASIVNDHELLISQNQRLIEQLQLDFTLKTSELEKTQQLLERSQSEHLASMTKWESERRVLEARARDVEAGRDQESLDLRSKIEKLSKESASYQDTIQQLERSSVRLKGEKLVLEELIGRQSERVHQLEVSLERESETVVRLERELEAKKRVLESIENLEVKRQSVQHQETKRQSVQHVEAKTDDSLLERELSLEIKEQEQAVMDALKQYISHLEITNAEERQVYDKTIKQLQMERHSLLVDNERLEKQNERDQSSISELERKMIELVGQLEATTRIIDCLSENPSDEVLRIVNAKRSEKHLSLLETLAIQDLDAQLQETFENPELVRQHQELEAAFVQLYEKHQRFIQEFKQERQKLGTELSILVQERKKMSTRHQEVLIVLNQKEQEIQKTKHLLQKSRDAILQLKDELDRQRAKSNILQEQMVSLSPMSLNVSTQAQVSQGQKQLPQLSVKIQPDLSPDRTVTEAHPPASAAQQSPAVLKVKELLKKNDQLQQRRQSQADQFLDDFITNANEIY